MLHCEHIRSEIRSDTNPRCGAATGELSSRACMLLKKQKLKQLIEIKALSIQLHPGLCRHCRVAAATNSSRARGYIIMLIHMNTM